MKGHWKVVLTLSYWATAWRDLLASLKAVWKNTMEELRDTWTESWADHHDRINSLKAQQQKANQQPVYEGYQRPGESVSTAFDVSPSFSLEQFRETLELGDETFHGIPISDEVKARIRARGTEKKQTAWRRRKRVPLKEKHIRHKMDVVSTTESREVTGENEGLRSQNEVTMEFLVEFTNMPLFNPETEKHEVEDSENIWRWRDETKTVAQLINRQTGEIIQYMDKTGMYTGDGIPMP